MNLNKIFLIGNLTRDPELRSLPSGVNVASFGLATNRFYTKDGQKQQDTQFHNIVAWNKLAELCVQLLKKGTKVYIEGRLQTRTWDDQKGQKHYKTEIIADDMVVVSSKFDRPSGVSSSSSEESVAKEPIEKKVEEPKKEVAPVDEVVSDEEMPF